VGSARTGQSGYPGDRRHEQRPDEKRSRRAVSARTFIPSLNVVPMHDAAASRTEGGHSSLADYFLAVYREKNRKPLKGISGKALDLLVRYDWPGNIRELENCIERAVIMAREEMISVADFPPQIQKLSGEGEKEGSAIPYGMEPRGDGEGTDS